jgi:hypothetical protein
MAGHGLAVAALVSWLLTEALGAVMLRSWIAGGGIRASRQRPAPPEVMSLPVLAGHAGLNRAGLLCWIAFVASGARPLAWLALVFLGPAIALGVSTVTIWTPYPARRPRHDGGDPADPADPASVVLPDELVRQAVADEALSRKLIDDLLERNLAQPSPRTAAWTLRLLIPFAHGVLAIATFMLAVLAAIKAM